MIENYYQTALEILEERGWTIGRIGSEVNDHETCAGGALAEAITGRASDIYADPQTKWFAEIKPWFVKLMDHVEPDWRDYYYFLSDAEAGVGYAVYRWNDRNTEETVKQGLREMAEMEAQ